jgi:hypothetical protein
MQNLATILLLLKPIASGKVEHFVSWPGRRKDQIGLLKSWGS